MQTFTIGWGRNWCIRALGRNPLVRATDRIEAIVAVLAILLALISVPIAGAIGTSVHEARTRIYAEEAQGRHIVTAVATGNSVATPNTGAFAVRVKWSVAVGDHVATLIRNEPVRAGAPLDIWVNKAGANVSPPSTPSSVGIEAVAVAVVSWLAIAGVAAGIAYGIRWSLNRRRYAQWQREISAWADGNGGRTNHQP